MAESYSRRVFLQKAAQITGSAVLGARLVGESVHGEPPVRLPRRKLGRTGVDVSIIGLGLASLGIAHYSPEEFQSVVQAALDQGVNYFDMQPDYGDAELYLAPIIRRHRDGLFLVTKTGEKSKTGVLESVRGSLDRLGVDRIDAVLLNNIGDYRLDEVFGKEGALAGLMEARRRGQARSFGISGHYQPEHFARCLETGEFDIAMAPFNFVDRFIYSFEQEILSVAAKHDVGVVAMKVFGGAVGLRYNTREQKALLAADEHKLSVRYALSLPGVCSAVIGCKSTSEVSIAANLGRTYCPLRGAEVASTQARGKQLASHWGRHYPEG